MDGDMRDRPDWMTIYQVQILRALGDPDIVTVLSPTIIADNLGVHRVTVSRALSEFVDRGLAIKHDDGKYEITDAGQSLLDDITI